MKTYVLFLQLVFLLISACTYTDESEQAEIPQVEEIIDTTRETTLTEIYPPSEVQSQLARLELELAQLEISKELSEVIITTDYPAYLGGQIVQLLSDLPKPDDYHLSSESWGYFSSLVLNYEGQVYIEIVPSFPYKKIERYNDENEWELTKLEQESIAGIYVKNKMGDHLLIVEATPETNPQNRLASLLHEPLNLQAFKEKKESANSGSASSAVLYQPQDVAGFHYTYSVFKGMPAGDEDAVWLTVFKRGNKVGDYFDTNETLVALKARINDPDLGRINLVNQDSSSLYALLGRATRIDQNTAYYQKGNKYLLVRFDGDEVEWFKFLHANTDNFELLPNETYLKYR